jgi:hypothetical protein
MRFFMIGVAFTTDEKNIVILAQILVQLRRPIVLAQVFWSECASVLYSSVEMLGARNDSSRTGAVKMSLLQKSKGKESLA